MDWEGMAVKQVSYALGTEADIASCLEAARAEQAAMPRCSAVLVQVFVRDDAGELLDAFRMAVRESFPQAVFFGAYVAIGIADGDVPLIGDAIPHGALQTRIIATVQFFETSHVELCSRPRQEGRARQNGACFIEAVQRAGDVRAAQFLLTDLAVDFWAFAATISEAAPDVVIFGGWTGWADPSMYLGGGRLIVGDAIVEHGGAVLLYCGAELDAIAEYAFGWQPLGHSVTVTRTDGPYCMVEVDGKPAAQFFTRYLGIEEGGSSFMDILSFPVCVERNGATLARSIRGFRADGGVLLGGDVRMGDKAFLSYGDPYAIIGDAMKAHERIHAFQPEAIQVVSCLGRQSYLQEDMFQELALLRKIAPSSGFYSYSELLYLGGDLMATNMSLITVGMREGAPKHAPRELPPAKRPVFRKQASIIAHLVHFIGAITEEWEAAHTSLLHFAERDDLTGLVNRRMVERELARVLPEAIAAGRPLSLLMLDLDCFKSINDTYGHAMGDRALKGLADVLRKCTRTEADMPSRWGGDEFIVILGGADESRALAVADRIRAEIKALEILPDGRHFTSSCGIATARGDDTPGTLFKRVDHALYKAKRVAGKGSVASA